MRHILAAIAVCLAMPAFAQQCGPRDDVAAALRGQYGERIMGQAIDVRGTYVTIWANLATGTWTITATRPDGTSCIVGAGENYEAVNEPQGVDG